MLVDAHALIWWLTDDRRLSVAARSAIEQATEPLVSAGTLIEIAVKRKIGKLTKLRSDWTEQTQLDGFALLPFGWTHVSRLERLPFVVVGGREHRDPFDRMLAAQALVEGIPVVTVDPAIGDHGVPVIW